MCDHTRLIDLYETKLGVEPPFQYQVMTGYAECCLCGQLVHNDKGGRFTQKTLDDIRESAPRRAKGRVVMVWRDGR